MGREVRHFHLADRKPTEVPLEILREDLNFSPLAGCSRLTSLDLRVQFFYRLVLSVSLLNDTDFLLCDTGLRRLSGCWRTLSPFRTIVLLGLVCYPCWSAEIECLNNLYIILNGLHRYVNSFHLSYLIFCIVIFYYRYIYVLRTENTVVNSKITRKNCSLNTTILSTSYLTSK